MNSRMSKIRTTRFSQSEDNLLIADANSMGVSVSKLIRARCGFEEKTVFNKYELRQSLFYIHKTSNNINQIGKALKIANNTFRLDQNTFELYLNNITNVSDIFKSITNDLFALKDIMYKVDMRKIINNLKHLSTNVNSIAKQLNIANLTASIEPMRYSNALSKLYSVKKILTNLETDIETIC